MWKCPDCGIEVDDERSICLQCGANKPDEMSEEAAEPEPEENNENPKTAHDLILDRPGAKSEEAPIDAFEVSYSGKAFRARCVLNWIITIACVAFGSYLTFSGVMGESGDSYIKYLWIVFLGIPAILWLFYACDYFYRTTTIKYRLTEHNLYYVHGFLKRTTDTLEVISIDDLQMIQTLWDRVLNGGVGSIQVSSKSDKTHPDLLMKGLEDPKRILDAIEDARRRRRSLRGVMQL